MRTKMPFRMPSGGSQGMCQLACLVCLLKWIQLVADCPLHSPATMLQAVAETFNL